MTLYDLKTELREIIEAEERAVVDWRAVEARCLELDRRVAQDPVLKSSDETVVHFLDDSDIRKKDARYGDWQRQNLRQWLATA